MCSATEPLWQLLPSDTAPASNAPELAVSGVILIKKGVSVMMIKTDIESAIKTALADKNSILPTYEAYDSPCNWVPFSGFDINDFADGEIVLMAWDASERVGGGTYYNWTFREVDITDRAFRRNNGFFSEPRRDRWNEYHIYRYQECVADETEILCAGLEDVL